MMNSDLFIDTDVQLHEFLDAIADETLLALDTEFVREKTYYPKLCLIQIATPDWTVCVDTLAGSPASAWRPSLAGIQLAPIAWPIVGVAAFMASQASSSH